MPIGRQSKWVRIDPKIPTSIYNSPADIMIDIAVRVRPPLKPTDPGYDLIPQRFRDSTCHVPTPTDLYIQGPRDREHFVFDRIFDEQTSQEGVWEYLRDSVTSFVKGYNVSILAYGQSGAGKSYTMGTSGPEEQDDPDIKGIVPRAAQALFEQLNGPPSRPSGLQTPKRYSVQLPNIASAVRGANGLAKNWELKATYVEIYNEQLRDLLLPESQERGQVAIREDTKGRIMLTGLTQVSIQSAEDVLNALNFGSTIRQTDATAINERSSRSHAVFSLNLVQKRTDVPPMPTPKADKRRSVPVDQLHGTESIVTTDSKLHFVDLAGSERLKNTGATGDRAKEGISINAGLASLGKVISQLSRNGSAHISYRDSRLTRLLQDSLGGNAITFMVACVTPASFHLSETLNTVHYARRARDIQSKPEIQQTHEDSDKQAAIDRLRAEVSFLRDQIRHSDGAGGRATEKSERSDRIRGRETELHSQLLDMQENYNALSQRHAKLIAEISKSRDSEDGATPLLDEAIGAHASERIRRSTSFAEAVEQVVLEYEKTIQSLETSLSKTRSSLASTESTLLEKETRIAYMDTIQHQLQQRVSKYMEREEENDNYTRNLEEKMEGATTEDERNSTLIAELRKEVARARDSEVGAEDYISTLEERLAEAEQDQEIMQREIDRLEHVVERQRSIGRLDNILGELDGIRGDEFTTNGLRSQTLPMAERSNGHQHDDHDPFRTSTITAPSSDGFENDDRRDSETLADIRAFPMETPRSPAQTEYMAEKLENLTQEIFDLRSEHENVLTDYDVLQQKYRTALETLAKLEYDKDVPKASQIVEDGHQSFLADAGMKHEGKATDGQSSSSRSLSAEQPSQEEQEAGAEAVKEHRVERTKQNVAPNAEEASNGLSPMEQDSILQEMETLKKLHAEKEVSVTELTRNYMSLAQRHEATLSRVEDLKQEVQKAYRASSPTFPGSPSFPKNLRRRSEELLSSGTDRASRSLVSLKALVYNNFEDRVDVRQSFEQNLNNVMAELHGRSERVQTLEAEIAAVKKEMETKQTIIAGLTRERSSLAASNVVDFSVVGQMRDQLMESENQIRTLHEQHAAREVELQDQVNSLKATLAAHQEIARQTSLPKSRNDLSHMPGEFPETPAPLISGTELSEDQAMAGAPRSLDDSDSVARLQSEIAAWESKHREVVDSMTATQNNLVGQIAELQDSLRSAGSSTKRTSPVDNVEDALDQQRLRHQEIVASLTTEVERHRGIAEERVAKLDDLQLAYDKIVTQVQDGERTQETTHKELATHRDLVANLESQLLVHKSAITIHQESLESLQSAHSKEIDELRESMETLERESRSKYQALEEHYEKITSDLERELGEAQGEITGLLLDASSALGYETSASKLRIQIKGLVDEGKELHGRHLKTTNELKGVQEELQSAINRSEAMESHISELRMANDEQNLNLEKMSDKYNKSSALCEQLEEQLNSTFDTHRATTNRLSTLETESGQARIEIEKELEEVKFRNNQLEVSIANVARLHSDTNILQQQLAALKHMSMASNVSANLNRDSLSPEAAAASLGRSNSNPRKSGPAVLPTPPPSIPLPPLPQSPTSGTPPMGSLDGAAASPTRGMSPTGYSPPTSRHGSREVPPSPAVTQLLEEQEARIRTIEKHLFAEKQLTATLEEALVDLETSANRTKSEMDNWRKKCAGLEDELVSLRKDHANSRESMQAVEEEREMRLRAERARQALEQRMQELNTSKKKKKSGLNCF